MKSGDEHVAQQVDQEERERYRELLEELRTIIPGAQVLFAFLLTVPFAARFSQVDEPGRIAFAVSLVAVAVATVLFLAPAAYHRIVGHRDRRARLEFGIRTALTGMVLLGLSITCALYVVVRFLFGVAAAAGLAGGAAAAMVALWFAFPLYRRRR